MLIKDEHFRNYYKKPIVIKDKQFAHEMARTLQIDSIMDDDPAEEEIRQRLASLEINEDINSLIVVPYIDHTAGISFMTMTTSTIDNDTIEIYRREDLFLVMANCRKDRVSDLEFEYLENLKTNEDFNLDDYSGLMNLVDNYRENDDVEMLRSLEILDTKRDDTFPDDVLVYFFKEGFNVEGMWVRYERFVEEHFIEGILLNTPNQDLGVKAGDRVKVFPYKPEEDAEWAIICDLNNV